MSNSSPLESIFFTALGMQSSAERAAFLDEACDGHGELHRRVDSMLRAQADAGSFLSIPRRRPTPPAIIRSAKAPARKSVPVSSWSKSVKGGWAWSSWPSKLARCSAAWR